MKFPKTMKTYCPSCNKHTVHEVEKGKKSKKRAMASGERRVDKLKKGYGSFPRSKPDHEKPTKKNDLRYKCTVCGKRHMRGEGWRAKKFEIVKV